MVGGRDEGPEDETGARPGGPLAVAMNIGTHPQTPVTPFDPLTTTEDGRRAVYLGTPMQPPRDGPTGVVGRRGPHLVFAPSPLAP